MNKIIKKTMLAPNVLRMEIEAKEIAKQRKAGQFIMLKIDEDGERIPLTIADANPEAGTVTIIAQVVGKTTAQLAKLNEGDFITDFAGPLGQPTHIEKFGHVVGIGGGIGIAPLHPIAQALKAAGNNVTGILGARDKSLFIMEEEMRLACNQVQIVTDNGSYGEKGFVTDALKKMVESGTKVDLVVAIGPPIMMKMVSKLTKELGNIPTLVSLNTIMIDGTGMCGGCRVSVGGKTKFVCVDGPEFDGHLVDFDEMTRRLGMYKSYEKDSMEKYEHNCRIGR
ncbi:MAG: sulfide/dihydroorotate dehydrogenase-like FAD/NAD-binding protein [Fibrobacteres bacterium]|nr:sulfide/dihydroorotate dehydrogenase-like FAD/NAD-binding protein [Fibrobacterota bacterium]